MTERRNESAGVCMTTRVLAVLVLCTAVAALPSSTDPSGDGSVCPENQFFDHGTSSCEDCSDICKDAEYKKTVEDCQRLCPAIYKAMQDEQRKPVVALPGESAQPQASPDQSSSSSSSSQLWNTLGGSLTGVLVIAAVIVSVVVWKVRQKKTTTTSQRSVAYSAAVQEEEGEQAAEERLSHAGCLKRWLESKGVLGAHSGLPRLPRVHDVESVSGREGPQEIVVLGGSHSSQGSTMGASISNQHQHPHQQRDVARIHSSLTSATAGPPRRPIYKPSATSRSPPRHSGPIMATPTLI